MGGVADTTFAITTAPNGVITTAVDGEGDMLHLRSVAAAEDTTHSVFAAVDIGSDTLARLRHIGFVTAAEDLVDGPFGTGSSIIGIRHIGTGRMCRLPDVYGDIVHGHAVDVVATEDATTHRFVVDSVGAEGGIAGKVLSVES